MSRGRFLRGKSTRRERRSLIRPVLGLTLQILVLGLVAWTAWSAWHAATDDDRFPVTNIAIRGVERANLSAMEERLAPARDKNLLTLDLDLYRRAAQADPWIRSVSLHRRLPGTLLVTVTERHPAAAARIGPVFYHVDRYGEVITEIPGGEIPEGPWLVGMDAVAEASRTSRLRAGVTAVEAIRTQHEAFLQEITRIDLADPRRVVLHLRDRSELWLPMERYPENLDRYFRLRDRIAAVAGPVRYADLRWDGQIAVMPADGGGR